MKLKDLGLNPEQYKKLVELKKEGIRSELLCDSESPFHFIKGVFPSLRISHFNIVEVTSEELKVINET